MIKYDPRQIYMWPLAPRAIVIALICLVVFYLGYLFDLSSLSKNIKTAEQQTEEYKSQVVSLARNQATINNDLMQYGALEKGTVQLQKTLINPDDLPELLNQIIKIGKENQLEFISFTPGAKVKSEAYFKVNIKAIVVGTYDQIASFMSQVANMEKIVAIGNFTITKIIPDKNLAEQSQLIDRLMADINFEVYEANAL